MKERGLGGRNEKQKFRRSIHTTHTLPTSYLGLLGAEQEQARMRACNFRRYDNHAICFAELVLAETTSIPSVRVPFGGPDQTRLDQVGGCA